MQVAHAGARAAWWGRHMRRSRLSLCVCCSNPHCFPFAFTPPFTEYLRVRGYSPFGVPMDGAPRVPSRPRVSTTNTAFGERRADPRRGPLPGRHPATATRQGGRGRLRPGPARLPLAGGSLDEAVAASDRLVLPRAAKPTTSHGRIGLAFVCHGHGWSGTYSVQYPALFFRIRMKLRALYSTS